MNTTKQPFGLQHTRHAHHPAFADITTTTDPMVFFDKDPQVKPDLLAEPA